MFGMLDYRAHKLFKLLLLPVRFLAQVVRFVNIGIAIFIASLTHYPPIIQIIIACLVVEAISMVVFGLFTFFEWALLRAFTYVIDVMPAHGANPGEALAIVRAGRFAELNLKLERDLLAWTPRDTDEYVSWCNWRARWFFRDAISNRIERTVHALQQLQKETGQQSFDSYTVKTVRLRESGKVPWTEFLMTSQPCFNSLIAFILIVVVIVSK